MNSNDLSNIITSFSVYKFLDALTIPFIRTDAYRLKIIDASGNLLKDPDKLDSTEKMAYNEFYRLVFSLKRLLLKIPDPYVRASLTNVTSALKLISEECESIGGNGQIFTEKILEALDSCRLLEQEGGSPIVAANSVSAGGIAGMKPEDIGIPEKTRNQISNGKKSIFKRIKPNTYYNDRNNSY